MSVFNKISMQVEFIGGTIQEAITEAIVLSSRENAAVKFEFNGTSVLVDTHALKQDIYGDWVATRQNRSEEQGK